MTTAAIAATYVDFKNVKTRRVVQIVFEVPAHKAEEALKMLGIPDAAQERWFAIAALKDQEVFSCLPEAKPQPVSDKPQAGAKRSWNDLAPSQQAGIRCEQDAFLRFLEEERKQDLIEGGCVADTVRLICGVSSRSELNTNHKARVIWHQLNDQYEAWMRIGA